MKHAIRRIATFSRGEKHELRLYWTRLGGEGELRLGIWREDEKGRWWADTNRFLTLRSSELGLLVHNMAKVVRNRRRFRQKLQDRAEKLTRSTYQAFKAKMGL